MTVPGAKKKRRQMTLLIIQCYSKHQTVNTLFLQKKQCIAATCNTNICYAASIPGKIIFTKVK